MIGLRRRRPLVCREAVELITRYLDGTLPAADVRRLEVHLAACPHCAEYLAQLQLTIALSGRIDPDALDDEAAESLTDVYRRWRPPED
jgi:anti-sigma factor RsiW